MTIAGNFAPQMHQSKMDITIQPSADLATELVARILAREIQLNPRAVLGLATGRTMDRVYSRLVQMHREEGLDFSGCRTFNLDEYIGLSPDDRHSYRHYMNQHLFAKVNIDLQNTHLPDGMAADPDAESQKYEQLIKEAGGLDLQLLGIGHSGHIGFNEPPSAFDSRTRVVTLDPVTIRQNAGIFGGEEKVPRQAITMGVKTILESRQCLLLATGRDKAEVVARAVEGPQDTAAPGSALQLHPRCKVIFDQAAAAGLKNFEHYRKSQARYHHP